MFGSSIVSSALIIYGFSVKTQITYSSLHRIYIIIKFNIIIFVSLRIIKCILLEFPQNNPQDHKNTIHLSQDLKKREKYKESLSVL